MTENSQAKSRNHATLGLDSAVSYANSL